jgi:ATP-binding cassette subfamily C protein
MNAPVTGKDKAAKLAPELRSALAGSRGVLAAAALFSGLINILALSSSLYMLQVYDRVIPSHSLATLIGLSVGMLMLFTAYGVLDVIRTKLMSRVAIRFDRRLRDRVMSLVLALPLRVGGSVDAQQPLRDLDQIRGFTASGGPVALFDMPWMPIYLALVWILHPWLGILATLGAIVLVSLTLITELRGRGPTRDMALSGGLRSLMAESARRNAASIQSMGMGDRVLKNWSSVNDRFLADHTAATDVIGTYGSISRVLRLLLQSAVLGLGAYLVIDGQATGGVMIAASILVSRALAPIEIAIANWRGFMSARQSIGRLSAQLNALPQRPRPLPLPKPVDRLEVEGLWVAPPGLQQPIVLGATFRLPKGSALGIVGPSASDKSTLVRAVIGAWTAQRGTVRLDGAALDQWAPEDLGAHIGYLPQEFELIDGTVAENISRFEPDAPSEAVIAAAREAGVHDMILRLAKGYDTPIGEAGTQLSAGQRQRIALARALYREPFLVVLDEPNSNLDTEGDQALENAIVGVRSRGGIVIIVAHRPTALKSVDYLLYMSAGQTPQFGTKEEIGKRLAALRTGKGPASAQPGQPAGTTALAPQQAAGAPRLMIITDGN